MSDIAAAVLPDGRIQAWRIIGGNLQTRWVTTSGWNAWHPDPNLAAPGLGITFPLIAVTAGTLSDGRLQLWVIDSGTPHKLYTCWKDTPDPNSKWSPWIKSIIQPTINSVNAAAAPLPDKRLQLFIIDAAGITQSAWKKTTDSTSTWTPFTAF